MRGLGSWDAATAVGSDDDNNDDIHDDKDAGIASGLFGRHVLKEFIVSFAVV